jgi:hypothetical protein
MHGSEVFQRVRHALAQVEAERNVRVLFACESGSRAARPPTNPHYSLPPPRWGFASHDSDYDVRFLYVHRRDWYLSVEDRRDVIEQPISDDLDVSGWELRKALRLLRKSNPPLLEWLKSPVVYRHDPVFAAEFGALATEFYCRSGGYAGSAPRPGTIGATAPRVRRGVASRTTCTWPSATGAITCVVARK